MNPAEDGGSRVVSETRTYLVADDVFQVPPRTRKATGSTRAWRVRAREAAPAPATVEVRVPTVTWGRRPEVAN